MKNRSPIKVKKIQELRSLTDKWLIDGLILNQGIALLTAPPKTMKSWFSMQTCLDLALGFPALDKFKTEAPSKVLYANFEDTEGIQKERLDLMLKAKGLQDAPNLNVLTIDDRLLIDTEDGIEMLRSVVNEVRPSLLVLDCWVRIVTTSETDTRGVAEVLHQLRKIRDDFKTAILLVHHASKGSSNKRAGDRLRGSGEFHAWAESILALKMDSDGKIFLDCEHRAAESFQNLPVVLAKDNEGLSVKALGTDSCALVVPQEPSNDDLVLRQSSFTKPVSLDELTHRTNIEVSELRCVLYRLLKNKTLVWTRDGYIRGSFQ